MCVEADISSITRGQVYEDIPQLFSKAFFQKNELKQSKYYQHHAYRAIDAIEPLIVANPSSDPLSHSRMQELEEGEIFYIGLSDVKEIILNGQQSPIFIL